MVTAVALETGIRYLIVRREAKGYGTGKQIEGQAVEGQRVVLVEDVLTTASQAISAAQRLTELGLRVERVIYVIDREEGAEANLREAGFEPAMLFRKSDLGV